MRSANEQALQGQVDSALAALAAEQQLCQLLQLAADATIEGIAAAHAETTYQLASTKAALDEEMAGIRHAKWTLKGAGRLWKQASAAQLLASIAAAAAVAGAACLNSWRLLFIVCMRWY